MSAKDNIRVLTCVRRRLRRRERGSCLMEYLLASYAANSDDDDGNEKGADGDEQPNGYFASSLTWNDVYSS